MYIIYTDEAGTADNEPVTVVASYNVEESKIRAALRLIGELFDEYVPPQHRAEFAFHAYRVWGDKRYREDWPMHRRVEFIGAMASVPRLLGGAITLSDKRREGRSKGLPDIGMKASEFDHFSAFLRMVGRADKYVRDWGGPESLAIVVAEDVPEKRRIIKLAFEIAQVEPGDLPLDGPFFRPTAAERAAGVFRQTNSGRAERVIDTVHFATRDHAPLLQVADACAFVFRRFLNSQSHGADWMLAMLDHIPPIDDWAGPASVVTIRFHD